MPTTLNEVSYSLDLTDELANVPQNAIEAVKRQIGTELIASIKKDTSGQRSPVDGSKYQGLSKLYKKIKSRQGRGTKADLKLTGSMLGSLKSESTAQGIKISIDSDQSRKGFNHQVGDTLPQRQFLPDERLLEDFRPDIMKKVNSIISANSTAPTTNEDDVTAVLESLKTSNANIPVEDVIQGSISVTLFPGLFDDF